MSKQASQVISRLIKVLPELNKQHTPLGEIYDLFQHVAQEESNRLFKEERPLKVEVEPFGEITLPYYKMGAIDSVDLWGLDELIIFSFYYANRDRYKKTLDIGGNLGLHSIIMDKCGYEVTCFEPDPLHLEQLNQNISYNNCKNITVEQAAVSDKEDEAEFVRIIGNTTSSHLAGAKSDTYGPQETFTVKTVDISKRAKNADLIKIDAEGHEATIINAIPEKTFKTVDIMTEVGTEENAQLIFDQLQKASANMFAQKNNWAKVNSVEDMPTSYKEGSLFISSKPEMPW